MKDHSFTMLIDGQQITTKNSFPVINPETEEVIAEAPVIAMANDTEYGLAAYVYRTNLSRGLRAAADIDAGSVCVNEVHYAVQLPHGGVKQSGVGKDCSRYSLQEYLTPKRVSVLIDQ